MKITKEKFIFFLLSLIALFPLAIAVAWPGNKLHFIACNVGQGDAILITQADIQVLVDGGPNNQVLDCLTDHLPFWDREIELVVSTHQDKDHLSGLVDVLANYQVNQLVINSLLVDTAVFRQFRQLVREKMIPVYSPQQGDIIKIGKLRFKVLWPQEKKGSLAMWQPKNSSQPVLGQETYQGKTNINSIVLHFQYQDFDALLTGDISAKEEKEIIKNYQFSDIEVLKVAHHGSKYSSSQEFLQAVKPKIAIISVGKNPWGHPTKEVLSRLKKVGAKILRTDKEKVNLLI